MVWGLQVLPQLSVVVNLAIDGKDDGLIRVGKGLGAGVWQVNCESRLFFALLRTSELWQGGQHTNTDNTKSFMAQDYENGMVSNFGLHVDQVSNNRSSR